MDDEDVGKQGEPQVSDPEQLDSGGWQDSLVRRLRRRGRLAVVVLLVTVSAFALGVGGTYLWMSQQRRHQPRIDAALYDMPSEFWTSNGRRAAVGIRLRNAATEPVTIEQAQLSRPGFDVLSPGLQKARTIAGNEVTEVPYSLSPDCRVPQVLGPTTLRLLAHAPGRSAQWLTITIPQPAADAAQNTFAGMHFQSCFKVGSIKLTTLRTSTSGGVLTLRVRLATEPGVGFGQPQPVRLLKVTAQQDPDVIKASFTSSGSRPGKPIDLPATGVLQLRIAGGQCAAPVYPMDLDASVGTSADTRDHVGMNYDAEAAAAVLDFTTKHCR
ncbi:hypothetical protein FOE78_15930 [Microlunatus elymi]|uniref:Uncharacterized protein n=1 Tax=Microlunatus elymi TaxID=2596828 RepID=A0A516Q1E2_9ACTN|nr:hypothetical protein [Microlunatus elymi]QDP97218.1 hypothetical protein FOE78_15930 [Microlunatus elymi]